MKYRVEKLAAVCGISVDTVRFYQSKGLVQAPEKEGRTAIYGPEHRDRIRRIRTLQKQGLTLNAIARVVRGSRADQNLVDAVARASSEALMTRQELAERSGVPVPLLLTVEAEGLLRGKTVDGVQMFSSSELELVQHGLRLIEAGLPINELLSLARKQMESAYAVAREAVRLFDEFVREPIKRSSKDEQEESERLTSAFAELLPAVTELVAAHFRRVLLDIAEKRIEGMADLTKVSG